MYQVFYKSSKVFLNLLFHLILILGSIYLLYLSSIEYHFDSFTLFMLSFLFIYGSLNFLCSNLPELIKMLKNQPLVEFNEDGIKVTGFFQKTDMIPYSNIERIRYDASTRPRFIYIELVENEMTEIITKKRLSKIMNRWFLCHLLLDSKKWDISYPEFKETLESFYHKS